MAIEQFQQDSGHLSPSRQRTLTNCVQRSIRHPAKCVSFYCFLQHDRPVCGGLPQLKTFWRKIQIRTSVFLRCGNQFCQLTIPVPARLYWRGCLTRELSSIGIGTTYSQKNWDKRLSLTWVNLSRNAAPVWVFSGMKLPSTPKMRTGMDNFRVPSS
jgi:hypothetical protein